MKTEKEIQERIEQIEKDLIETYLIAEDDYHNYGITHDVSINVMQVQKNLLEWVLDSAQKENKTEDKDTEYRTDYYKY